LIFSVVVSSAMKTSMGYLHLTTEQHYHVCHLYLCLFSESETQTNWIAGNIYQKQILHTLQNAGRDLDDECIAYTLKRVTTQISRWHSNIINLLTRRGNQLQIHTWLHFPVSLIYKLYTHTHTHTRLRALIYLSKWRV